MVYMNIVFVGLLLFVVIVVMPVEHNFAHIVLASINATSIFNLSKESMDHSITKLGFNNDKITHFRILWIRYRAAESMRLLILLCARVDYVTHMTTLHNFRFQVLGPLKCGRTILNCIWFGHSYHLVVI